MFKTHIFFIVAIYLCCVTLHAQIESPKYFKNILATPKTEFINTEVLLLKQNFNFDSNQIALSTNAMASLYENLQHISTQKLQGHINTLLRNLEWNYELYQYYTTLETLSTKQQITEIQKIFPEQKRRKALKFFRRTGLITTCSNKHH